MFGFTAGGSEWEVTSDFSANANSRSIPVGISCVSLVLVLRSFLIFLSLAGAAQCRLVAFSSNLDSNRRWLSPLVRIQLQSSMWWVEKQILLNIKKRPQ